MPRKRRNGDISKARQQRQDMSLPEVLLWNLLRKSPEGVHFRRQEGIGKYILDFYCAKPQIGFEIDGISHNMGDRPERDGERDAWLQQQGIEIVRIPAADVLKSPEDIAEAIVRYCLR